MTVTNSSVAVGPHIAWDAGTMAVASSSQYGGSYGPDNTLNGSGLNTNTMAHWNDSYGYGMWLTTDGGATNAWIRFDLGQTFALAKLRIWNCNQNYSGSGMNRGIKRANVLVSIDGANWTSVASGATWPQASGTANYLGFDQDMGGASGRYVRVECVTNFASDAYGNYAGLSEVWFYQAATNASCGTKTVISLDEAYQYDGLQQLIRMDRSNGVIQASDLESAGNWATFTDETNVQTRAHNAGNEMTAIGGATNTLAHDLAGNMVRIPVAGAEADRHYDAVYDAWNQLVQVSTGGVPVTRCSYDGAQRRIRKATSASTNDFYYDGWLLIQETQSGTGVSPVTNTYVWGLDLSGTLQGAGGIGGLLSILTPDSCPLTPVSDANGNVTKLLTSTGTVTAAYVYDPYGGTISMSGTASTNNVFRFSSKYLDQETGLYYYGYRFYAPTLGRWVSRDPITERGCLELYSFVRNNPVDDFDLEGLLDITPASPSPITCAQMTTVARWILDRTERNGFVIQAVTLDHKVFSCRSGRILRDRSLYSYFEAWGVRGAEFVPNEGKDKVSFEYVPGLFEPSRECTRGEFRFDAHGWFVHDRAIPAVMVPGTIPEAGTLPSVGPPDDEIVALYPSSYRKVIRRDIEFHWDCCKKPPEISYVQRISVFGGAWRLFSYP